MSDLVLELVDCFESVIDVKGWVIEVFDLLQYWVWQVGQESIVVQEQYWQVVGMGQSCRCYQIGSIGIGVGGVEYKFLVQLLFGIGGCCKVYVLFVLVLIQWQFFVYIVKGFVKVGDVVMVENIKFVVVDLMFFIVNFNVLVCQKVDDCLGCCQLDCVVVYSVFLNLLMDGKQIYLLFVCFGDRGYKFCNWL